MTRRRGFVVHAPLLAPHRDAKSAASRAPVVAITAPPRAEASSDVSAALGAFVVGD